MRQQKRPSKRIVESSYKIDAMLFKKWNFFSNSNTPRRVFWSRTGTKTKSVDALINLENNCIDFFYNNEFRSVQLLQTKCNFGNNRYWFKCPCCKKRMRTLYIYDDGIFCRNCSNLSYRSQNISGTLKQFGRIIFQPELNEMLEKIKKRYYRDVPTKNYQRYLKEQKKTDNAIKKAISML